MDLDSEHKSLVDHLCERYGCDDCILVFKTGEVVQVANTEMTLNESWQLLGAASHALALSVEEDDDT